MIVTKHENPAQTLVYSIYVISKELRRKRIVSYDNLKVFLQQRVEGGEFWFDKAINFLFLMGIVEYYPKTDMLEFVQHETE